jgi:hypothetical protein
VSAPSDPSSSRQTETGPSNTRKTRRARQWRARARAVDRSGTAATSDVASLQGQSADDVATSSAAGMSSTSGSQAGTVRFASGS